jgi:hypothetical protein
LDTFSQSKIVRIEEVQLKSSVKNNIFQTISDLDIHLRPINNSQEILRSVPGLFIGNTLVEEKQSNFLSEVLM